WGIFVRHQHRQFLNSSCGDGRYHHLFINQAGSDDTSLLVCLLKKIAKQLKKIPKLLHSAYIEV
ncbi:hypothetical protein Q6247_26390, partial [Klebsiella pneumoniae]